MFEGIAPPVSPSAAGRTGARGARKRAPEPRERKTATGTDRARQKAGRPREAGRRSRTKAGVAAAELHHLIQAAIFRWNGGRTTVAGQPAKEEPAQAGWPARSLRPLAWTGAIEWCRSGDRGVSSEVPPLRQPVIAQDAHAG